MIAAVVGAGGKTTLIHTLAAHYRSVGKSVFVTTSTHMFIEPDTLLTDDPAVIVAELDRTGYAMAGLPFGEKIKPLSPETYAAVCRRADVVLVEADGARHMAVKFPGPNEPVIPENTGEILVVCGMHALGKTVQEAAFRPELVCACLGIGMEEKLTEEHIYRLVSEGYRKPLSERYPNVHLTVHPMSDGSAAQEAAAAYIRTLNEEVCHDS